MKTLCKTLAVCAAAIFLAFSCKPAVHYTPAEELKGIVLNEICPAIESSDESWVEIVNTGNAEVSLSGLKLLVTDDYYSRFAAFEAQNISLMPDARYVMVPDKVGIKLSTIEEIVLTAGDGTELAVIDTRALAAKGKPQKGGSWSRIPDITGDIIVTETATKGEKNYKFVPYKIDGVILNEVSVDEGWVEIYNNGIGAINLDETTIVITKASGEKETAFKFSAETIPARSRSVIDVNIAGMKELRIVSNEGKTADSLIVANVTDGEAASGQSYAKLPDITGNWYTCSVPTPGQPNADVTSDVTKLVINEVSTEGWMEVYNPTVRTISANGVKAVVDERVAGTVSGNLEPKATVVFTSTITPATTVELQTATGSVIDKFSKASVKDAMEPVAGGSWSRIPDGDSWYTVKTASKNASNYGIIKGNTNGIWYNQSNTPSLENNLDEFARKGIGHVFLHEYAFKYYENLIPGILAKAEKLGITIHIWMQCFWWNDGKGVNGWRSPVDDEHKCYDQALFDDILSEERAVKYVKAGVKGIHFDYIRYGGTAYKHDYPEVGITGVGSINEFLRQADAKLRGINPDLIMSAALMNETGSEKYYGQRPEDMSKYLDILIPMIYRHQTNKFSDANCIVKANWFAEHGLPAQCWAGTDTYEGNNGLSEDIIYKDCCVYRNSKAKGVSLFRHGIGGIPNLLDIKLNEE